MAGHGAGVNGWDRSPHQVQGRIGQPAAQQRLEQGDHKGHETCCVLEQAHPPRRTEHTDRCRPARQLACISNGSVLCWILNLACAQSASWARKRLEIRLMGLKCWQWQGSSHSMYGHECHLRRLLLLTV